MNNNIFENAKFGDKFKTRDGRVAIYYHNFDCENGDVFVAVQTKYGSAIDYLVSCNGIQKEFNDEPQDGTSGFDIVFKLEEKPIEEMTFKLHHLVGVGLNTCHGAINLLIEALKNRPGLLGKKYKLSIKWIEE